MDDKKEIKVYLQYPWKFPDSPYYKYLIENSPKGITYLNTENQKGVITNKKKFLFSNLSKKFIRGLINLIYPSMPNSHLSPRGDYDLIHCCHCLSKNKNKPWVLDLEAFWQLWVVGLKGLKGKNKIRLILENKNCKKIMPWTKKIEKNFLYHFPTLKNKTEVVYPSIPIKIYHKDQKSNTIILLFVGRYFFEKGGLHALEAINYLTKKYPFVKGIVVSNTPKGIKEKYSLNKKITFYDLLSKKELFKIYKKADILIYPGYTDSFGFIFLESMSFGIPIITVDGDCRKEIIKDKKTGYVIPYISSLPPHVFGKKIGKEQLKIIKQIINKASYLIENRKQISFLSKNCIQEINKGKFSIEKRNEKLKKIYEEALK